jgi:hypothetical protein
LGCRAFFNYININYWGIYPSRPFACWAAHWHTYVFVLHSWDLIKNLPYSAAQSGMQFFQIRAFFKNSSVGGPTTKRDHTIPSVEKW